MEREVVLVSVELEGGLGKLPELLALFPERDLLNCVVWIGSEGHSARASLFLSRLSAQLEELERLPHAKRVRVVRLSLLPKEARPIVLTLEDFRSSLSGFRELGSGGLAIMYYMGYKLGETLADRIRGEGRRALEQLLTYCESLGYGEFELVSYEDRSYCRVRAKNLFECTKGSRGSQIFRGMLSGFLARVWRKEVGVVEVACAARLDPYCEFEARGTQ